MGAMSVSGLDDALRAAARLGPERTLFTRLRRRVESFLSAGDLDFDRNFLIVRPAIALCVIFATLMPGERLPGRDGVITACGIAIAYNFVLAYLVARKHVYVLRSISL